MLSKAQETDAARQALARLLPLAEEAARRLGRRAVLMEVCGTHTMAIARSGIKSLLAGSLDLRSGPGCPVCVTEQRDIDKIIAMAGQPGVVIATFGDMLRVPGTKTSLEVERARGARVEIFYSPMEAVEFAARHPQKEVVFLGVGFETTTPALALSIAAAKSRGLTNYSVFSVHKLVPPVMRALLSDPDLNIDGLLLPGHVCTITGRKAFDFVSAEYRAPAVVAGFEPVDILEAIYALLKQITAGQARTLNGYARLVREEGNRKAKEIMAEIFEPTGAAWRGFGEIAQSGLTIRKSYADYDAAVRFPVEVPEALPPKGCACGEVLKGKITADKCKLFGRVCTPSSPVGPCMVSLEGACAAYYQYERHEV
ncbi:MAG: hydrogenase formation protein HypD [Desulfotomaculaceae bacterium]|nr:hydrogenase formation protein HypD [Desulfotomaculaceae bacterium]